MIKVKDLVQLLRSFECAKIFGVNETTSIYLAEIDTSSESKAIVKLSDTINVDYATLEETEVVNIGIGADNLYTGPPLIIDVNLADLDINNPAKEV